MLSAEELFTVRNVVPMMKENRKLDRATIIFTGVCVCVCVC